MTDSGSSFILSVGPVRYFAMVRMLPEQKKDQGLFEVKLPLAREEIH